MDKMQQAMLIEMCKKTCRRFINDVEIGGRRATAHTYVIENYHSCKQWIELYELAMSLNDKEGVWKAYNDEEKPDVPKPVGPMSPTG